MIKLAAIFLVSILSIAKVECYFVTIDAHADACFYERVEETGIKVGKRERSLLCLFGKPF